MYVLITESLAYCQSSNENLMKIMHPEILRVIKFTDYIACLLPWQPPLLCCYDNSVQKVHVDFDVKKICFILLWISMNVTLNLSIFMNFLLYSPHFY